MDRTRERKSQGGRQFPYWDLCVGDVLYYTASDGARSEIRLCAADEKVVTLEVDASRIVIPLGHFSSTITAWPAGDVLNVVDTGRVKVGAVATSALMKGTKYSLSLVNLRRDARICVGEAGRCLTPQGRHVFPLPSYDWNFADNWLTPVPYGWHLGIDLNAERGHPIVSISDGKVLAIRHFPQDAEEDYWGNNLGILGDDGILYCYMHWDSLAQGIKEGCSVRAGDHIGLLGRSGFETKPFPSHVHIEMMLLSHPEKFYFAYTTEPDVLPTPNRYLQADVDGYVINPYPYLMEWYLDR